jgi:uncharacterized membrane protein
MEPMITSPVAVLGLLTGIIVVAFAIEQKYSPKLFQYLPPLIWIYLTPLVLAQTGIIPMKSDAYTTLKTYGLPVFLTAMLIEIDIKTAFGVMRSAVGVMLFGTVGVIVGLSTGYLAVHSYLSPEAWKGFGSLAGSWIGGLGNMAAVTEALQTPGSEFGLAVVADNFGYLIWLPIVLGAKKYAKGFAKFTGAPEDGVEKMIESQSHLESKSKEMRMFDLVALLFLGFGVAAIAELAVPYLLQIPWLGALLGKTTWKVLVLTSIAIPLSLTRLRTNIRGNFVLGQAIIYIFVAVMGASADLSGFDQAPAFVLGALIGLTIHMAFMILGAKILKADVHTTAIASAANIGAAATGPVVAAFHNERLVPMSILLALIGYAIGNYAALIAAYLCQWIGA